MAEAGDASVVSRKDSGKGQGTTGPAARRVTPGRAIGWWALGLSAVGLAAWVFLPVITVAYRETYPVTDSWMMPAIGLVLTDVAAAFNALCIWRFKERSVLNIVAAVLTMPAALFVTLMVAGEGLAGV